MEDTEDTELNTTDAIRETLAPKSPPSKKGFYHPELDVLRFVAFLAVFLGHLNYSGFDPLWPTHIFMANVVFAMSRAGGAGLTLFFALSAFLITELLLQEQAKTGKIHFRDFYVRRILRIWPLYFVFLLLVRPLFSRFLLWDPFPTSDLLAFMLLAGNWILAFRGISGSVADPLWSISIEEQFYIAWPLVVRYSRRHLPTVAYAMILVSNIVRIAILVHPTGDIGMSMWCNTFARLDSFAIGALAAHYLHGRELRIPVMSRVLLVALSIFTLLLTGRYGDHINDRSPLTYPMESLSCIVLLLAVLVPLHSWTPGIVGQTFVYLGKISYGLYVFHVLFIRLVLAKAHLGFFFSTGVALALTICMAAISYAFLEKPFLRLKQRFTYVRSRL